MDRFWRRVGYRPGKPTYNADSAFAGEADVDVATLPGLAELSMDVVADAVVRTDAAGRIESINLAAQRLVGFSREEVHGLRADQVLVFRSVETNARLASPITRCLAHGRPVQRTGRSLLEARGGRRVVVRETATPMRDDVGQITGAFLVLRDLSRQTDLAEQLAWRERHDPLTGLYNREEFERQLRREISLLGEQQTHRHSLLYFDLDRFRLINDTAGRAVGDRGLLQVARLLQDIVRGTDVVARLGDDEFAVLLIDCSGPDATSVAWKIERALRQNRLRWRQHVFRLTASIGVVGVAPGETTDEALAAADVACAAAKRSGRNTVRYLTASEVISGSRDMDCFNDIVAALDEDRLRIYCQPIVPIGPAGSAPPHFELLLRCDDRNGGVAAAKDFLPVAERYNLMPTIDRWVLRYALEHLAALRGCEDGPDYMLAVNLSGNSLSDPAFLDFARAEIGQSAIADGALCFEITETAAIDDLDSVSRFMQDLRQLGCRFALDDFGAGQCSLTYLSRLPVDYLKIDGSFIREIDEAPRNAGIVSVIGALGASFRVKTVAEWVENRAVLDCLETLGVDFGQGHFFSQPVPVRDRGCLRRLIAAADTPSRP